MKMPWDKVNPTVFGSPDDKYLRIITGIVDTTQILPPLVAWCQMPNIDPVAANLTAIPYTIDLAIKGAALIKEIRTRRDEIITTRQGQIIP